MNKKKKAALVGGAVIAAIAAILAIIGISPAQAASKIYSSMIADQTIQSRDIAAGGVGTSEVRNQSLQSGDIGSGGVGTSEIRNGNVYHQDLSTGVWKMVQNGNTAFGQNKGQDNKISDLEDRVEAEEAEGDTGAVVSAALGASDVVIEKIGGPFAPNATVLDTETIPAGTYLVNTYAFFDRVDDAQASSPVLQVAVRGVDGSPWGKDLGTVFTGEFPATGNLEQTASGTRVVTFADDTEVKVYGFGYNADKSASGSGNYKVNADVSFVPVG